MELLMLNENFEPIKYITYTNLQWDRKYYEAGQFSIQIIASDYSQEMKYVYTNERPELGVIHLVQYEDKVESQYIQLSGYFYQYKLNDKIIYPRTTNYGTPEEICRELIQSFGNTIPNLELGDLCEEEQSIIRVQSTGKSLGKRLYDILQTQEMSYNCKYNYEDNKVYFTVYKGKDRTQDQFLNPFITFSKGFKNLLNVNASIDSSAVKNYAVVVGNGDYESGNQKVITIDLSNGGYKQEVYIDLTTITYNEEEQTEEQYLQELYQEGLQKLSEYVIIDNVEFTTDTVSLEYMKDFDLGDKCDIIVDELGVSYQTRIVEIYEVFKNGSHEIKITVGELKPTIYKKVRV